MTIFQREMVIIKYRIIYYLNHALFPIVIGMQVNGKNPRRANNWVFSFRAKHDDERAEGELR